MELINSYNEIYFPMHELLRVISNSEDKLEKHNLIDDFFEKYSGAQAPIRFIGSSFLMEYYYELREKY
jgi:hypothetical protein